jgi:hypothetical protein
MDLSVAAAKAASRLERAMAMPREAWRFAECPKYEVRPRCQAFRLSFRMPNRLETATRKPESETAPEQGVWHLGRWPSSYSDRR